MTQDLTAIEALDTEVWRNVAQDTSGVQLVPTGTVYKISWDAPATGYSLRSKASLTGAWVDPSLPVLSIGGRKVTHVLTADLPSAGAGFFAVQKQ